MCWKLTAEQCLQVEHVKRLVLQLSQFRPLCQPLIFMGETSPKAIWRSPIVFSSLCCSWRGHLLYIILIIMELMFDEH
jgi:hypothetical protein